MSSKGSAGSVGTGIAHDRRLTSRILRSLSSFPAFSGSRVPSADSRRHKEKASGKKAKPITNALVSASGGSPAADRQDEMENLVTKLSACGRRPVRRKSQFALPRAEPTASRDGRSGKTSIAVLAVTASLVAAAALPAAASAAAPSVEPAPGSASSGTVLFAGLLNPNGEATDYHFEYGPDQNYGSTTPTESAGSGIDAMHVHAKLHGLQKGQTYHYRLVAENPSGTTQGPDQSVTPRQGLPDDRAYELVSPPDKNGGYIVSWPTRNQAATDGNAFRFSSLVGFGDVQGGSVIGFEYMAKRTDDGWETHGISPSQEPPLIPTSKSSTYLGAFSDDLDKGIFLGMSPILDTPTNVDQTANLYLRTDARNPGKGDWELLSDAVAPVSSDAFLQKVKIHYAGVSDDLSHVAFQTTDNLTADASGSGPKAYEWHNGTVRLVGIRPDGTPAPTSGIGGSATNNTFEGWNMQHALNQPAISDDGNRIVFVDGPSTSATFGSSDQFASGASFGQLYLRESATDSIKINVSERTDCAGDGTCGGNGIPDPAPDPGGAKPAAFLNATPGLDVIVFMSAEKLTDEDSNTNYDAYRWERGAPEGERLQLISGPGVGTTTGHHGVLAPGISDDGNVIYFASSAPLFGEPFGTAERADIQAFGYVWDNGNIRPFGTGLDLAGDPPGGDCAEWGGNRRPCTAFRVSSDGRFALFGSASAIFPSELGYNVTPAGGGTACEFAGGVNCANLFLYDLQQDLATCLTCPPSGADLEGHSLFTSHVDTPFQVPNVRLNYQNRLLLDEGRVYFSSPAALVANDSNGRSDVYEYDHGAGELTLLTSGVGANDALVQDVTPDGKSVFFTTTERLVGIDRDDVNDLYVARAGGGISSQSKPPAVPCEGDGCQEGPGPAPADDDPGSSQLDGAGNPVLENRRTTCRTERERLRMLNSKAQRLETKERRLKRRARKAPAPGRARRLERKASRVDKRAKRVRKKTQSARGVLRDCRRDR